MLTADEKALIRHHLGYMGVTSPQSIILGLPKPQQTLFILEANMDKLLPQTEDRARRCVQVMERIECLLVDAQDRLAASALGELKLRDNEPDRLEREYVRWGMRLADAVGSPIYPYSERYRRYMSGGINVAVSG